MADKHLKVWQGLNERQQKYLEIVYQFDQRAEDGVLGAIVQKLTRLAEIPSG